jgi:hypothetical protein
MRELVSEVDAEIRDIRGVRESHSEFCNPEATRLPSLLGEAMRRAGASGGGGGLQVPSIFGYRGITGSNM